MDALERLTRHEVVAAQRLRRVVRAPGRLDALTASLEELVGERVQLLVRRHRRTDAARSSLDAVAVALAMESDRTGERLAILEVEAAFAVLLASRVLKRPAPRVIDPSRPAPPALVGAFA